METKTERWTLRVTPGQDAVVRRAIEATGESLSEYVIRHAVEAAENDVIDRRIFAVDEATWNRVQELLDRPPIPKPALTRLLAEPSVLESPAG